MTAKRLAILVAGPESSGTRMHTRIMIAAGFFGNDTHAQELDKGFQAAPDRIVFRRSMPHNRKWPDLHAIVADLRAFDYEVKLIVCMRSVWAMIRSQIRAGHAADRRHAANNIDQAYREIYAAATRQDVLFYPSQFDALTGRHWKAACVDLIRWTGTPAAEAPAALHTYFIDSNAPHAAAVLKAPPAAWP
jgi:hypothetical protein